MREAKLESARLPVSPWSDYYWPYYSGGIAHRYLDPAVPESLSFQDHFDYLSRTLGRVDPRAFSPAEKYDLLVGDRDFSLTRAMLEMGRKIFQRRGDVEEWMGLCYGWAAVAIELRRPAHSVSVLAADGMTRIEFLPSDIKALAALLWDTHRFRSREIGLRCRDRNPPSDPKGHSNKPKCLDTNPATWHLAVVNQVGAGRRSFVMDLAYDYEVWNQPVLGYSYRHFNPKTGLPAATPAEGSVRRADFPEDPFGAYRSRGAVTIVGVEMDVQYVRAYFPSDSAEDDESRDFLDQVTYRYDLELDRAGKIIGGEWHEDRHPDFLWAPVPGARAKSVGDEKIPEKDSWKREVPLPDSWARVARATSRKGQPLAAIVEELFVRAARD